MSKVRAEELAALVMAVIVGTALMLPTISATALAESEAAPQSVAPAPARGTLPLVPFEQLGKTMPPIDKIEKIAENLYLIPGQGCNTTVWVYSSGVLIVDSKLPQNEQKLIELIRTVTDKPVTHIVNTHAHGDHTGSNAEFPAEVEIVAQENTLARMQNMNIFKTEASKVGLPHKTFKSRLTLFKGKDAVDLYYFGPAHTDGDTVVVFRSARVMHAGDLIKKKEFPTIDGKAGGSGLEFAATVGKAAATIKNVDRVITGHGNAILSWQDFTRYAELARLLVAHERAAFKAGLSPEQTFADFKPPAEFDDFDRVGSSFGGLSAVQTTFEELRHSRD